MEGARVEEGDPVERKRVRADRDKMESPQGKPSSLNSPSLSFWGDGGGAKRA